jgi:hypothetical protein
MPDGSTPATTGGNGNPATTASAPPPPPPPPALQQPAAGTAPAAQPQQPPAAPQGLAFKWEGKVGDLLNLPAQASITEKKIEVTVNYQPGKEKGRVHWGYVVGAGVVGIGLGVGATFAAQSIWGGEDESKPAKK